MVCVDRYEQISNYSSYDITGISDELMKDDDFLMDLKIISCELDISKYVNPKSSAFLKIIKKTYQKNKENEIKKQMTGLLDNKDKLDKIINLNKK